MSSCWFKRAGSRELGTVSLFCICACMGVHVLLGRLRASTDYWIYDGVALSSGRARRSACVFSARDSFSLGLIFWFESLLLYP